MDYVLIIEDNLEIRENTAEMLELSGFGVYTAANGQDGLMLAVEKLPDLILCDIMLPGLNGFEVFRKLKENKSTSSIPFVFESARTEKKDINEGLEMGATGYIAKPYELNELIEKITSCLKKHTSA